MSVAVIVGVPAVLDEVILAEYVPSPLSVVDPTCCAPSVLDNATVSPLTPLSLASVTVAVACELAFPSAAIELGSSETET